LPVNCVRLNWAWRSCLDSLHSLCSCYGFYTLASLRFFEQFPMHWSGGSLLDALGIFLATSILEASRESRREGDRTIRVENVAAIPRLISPLHAFPNLLRTAAVEALHEMQERRSIIQLLLQSLASGRKHGTGLPS
jgi:hypothetical protein